MAKKTNWHQGCQAGAASSLVVTDDRTVGSRSTATGATAKVSDNTSKDAGTTRDPGLTGAGTLVSKGTSRDAAGGTKRSGY